MRLIRLVLPALVVLTACGGSDGSDASGDSAVSGSPDPSGPSVSATESIACGLLDAAQVAELAGQELGEPAEIQVAGAMPGCVWGSLDGVGVQAAVVDASLWARSLPAAVEQIKDSGVADDGNLRKLRDAADLIDSGEDLPAGQACALFTDLVELNGEPHGADLTVTLFPNAAAPQAVIAQACRDETYATVLVARPGLEDAPAVTDPVREAVEGLLS